MSKIAIVSTLANFDQSYSLVTVIVNQARLLKQYAKLPVELWVLTNCKDDYPEDIKENVVKCIPSYLWKHNKVNSEMVPVIQNAFQERINGGVNYILSHDLTLQKSFLSYNEAIRRISGVNPGVKWFLFHHSAPHPKPPSFENRSEKLTHTLPYNSKLIGLNYLDLERAAQMYMNTRTIDCHVVYNPIEIPNLADISDPLAKTLANECKFEDASVRVIYPFSTTRMESKQVKYVMEMLSIMKDMGESVRFIACNCHCNASREKATVENFIKRYTEKPYSLKRSDILFTSQFQPPTYEYSIPWRTVLDLFKMSNLFIFPTMSEGCPLILQEAAVTNNLIVTNLDFPPLMEIPGINGALHFKFGSALAITKFGKNNTDVDRMNHFKWYCENIVPELNRGWYQTNAMINIKNNYSFEAVWNKQMRWLFNM